jgi:hypothetical protein
MVASFINGGRLFNIIKILRYISFLDSMVTLLYNHLILAVTNNFILYPKMYITLLNTVVTLFFN